MTVGRNAEYYKNWWNNHVKESRETTLKRLQKQFGSEAKIRPFGGNVMASKHEAYSITTDLLVYEDIQTIERNSLEIIGINSFVDSEGNSKIIVNVQREGTVERFRENLI